MLLQVPVPQAVTCVPAEPEYHGDRTLVHFRFGWDLADRVRAHGFTCATLVTSELRDAAAARRSPWVHEGADCDVDDLVDRGFETLIHHNETAVKILVSPTGQGL